MRIFTSLKQYFLSNGPDLKGKPETDPGSAYNLWALSYDNQPDNLMLALDEDLFSTLTQEIELKDASICDVGCGTGRHWKKIMASEPENLFGFDVSEGMLQILRQKFHDAKTFLIKDQYLLALENNSCDLVISTLAIAHIENIELALKEWCRVLKQGGLILITDYHPAALAKGATRTFCHQNKLIAVRNHIHTIESIRRAAGLLQLEVLQFIEKKIDESVRPYYEKQDALSVFNQFKDTPIIYGILLKKTDAFR
jgi:ubiquinone/menaquinone biosynthesis C-methylase UbiE